MSNLPDPTDALQPPVPTFQCSASGRQLAVTAIQLVRKMIHPKAFLMGLLLVAQGLDAAPPFFGTIFISPNIITSADPTTSTGITDAGRGMRLMFDRRVNNFVTLDAYLFSATFSDGLQVEVQVNPEFGSASAAAVEAAKYTVVIGRLPKALRLDVQTIWIHQGVQPFGGGNNNLLIHTGQGELYAADGILEETFVHEACHSSLDAGHAAATGWLAAQAADPEFISTYARDNPTREDIAESFLTWLAVRVRQTRIPPSLATSITTAIPQRLAYFDLQNFDMNPMVPDPTLTVTVTRSSPAGLVVSWPTNTGGFNLQAKSSLEAGTAWLNVTNPPVVISGRLTVTNSIAGPAQFLRLRRP